MNDHHDTADAGTDAGSVPPKLPEARQRVTRWPGWVWAIPLAALIFVGWLAAKTWLFGPPEIVVHFNNAAGISVGAAVRYKGVQVGRVKAVRLDMDRHGVDLVLGLNGPWDGRPGKRTSFWIVRPDLASGQIQQLISGAYVAMQPGGGVKTEDFTGRAAPPILAVDRPGRSFLLTAADVGKVSQRTPVVFHGVTVGRVTGVRFDAKAGQARIHVFVRRQYARLVRRGTIFWRTGDLTVLHNPAGLKIRIPSMASLISGAITFRTPDVFPGPRAKAGDRFALYDSRDRAEAVANGPRVAFAVRFSGAVGGLAPGAAVMLGSKRVGRVTRVGLSIDAGQGRFATPVGIVLDARAFQLKAGRLAGRAELRKRLRDEIAALVAKGLRARLGSSGLLASGKPIELARVKDAKPATLDRSHEPPLIPAAQEGDQHLFKAPKKQAPTPKAEQKSSKKGGKDASTKASQPEPNKPGKDGSTKASQPETNKPGKDRSTNGPPAKPGAR